MRTIAKGDTIPIHIDFSSTHINILLFENRVFLDFFCKYLEECGFSLEGNKEIVEQRSTSGKITLIVEEIDKLDDDSSTLVLEQIASYQKQTNHTIKILITADERYSDHTFRRLFEN